MKRLALVFGLLTLLASPALALDENWPIESDHPEATIVMYQPQIEQLTENDIEARAAVSVTPKDSKVPVFGAVWMTARLEIDRETRMVSFRNIRVPQVRFADASEEHKEALARYLEEQMPTWEIDMELDRLIPLLELAEHESPREAGLKHDPPKIVVSAEPATLVVIDGQPRMQQVTTPEKAHKKKIQRVVNTPVLIAYEPKTDSYYLAGGGDLWYEAADVLGPYNPAAKVPKVVRSLALESDEEAVKSDEPEGKPPKIVVATEPTELIVVVGEPEYTPLGEVDLLTVSNTDRDVLLEMGSNDHYVLLSGRWYVSKNKLDGPWSFVPPAELPESFGDIPADSDLAHLRAHVPGTVEAQEAVLDSTIPQTAAIRRDDRSFNARYDGAPKFEDVEEAGVQYAVNSPQSVFKVSNRYYACDQGVWYESNAATGPWMVATSVPDVIYDIPASNPHHNVTYVRVYDVQPEVVYVGYTPGYVGSYVYGGCVVYGTGWYYPGWYGTYYYPRPHTWGFHATYNPWYGWGFGISWSSGPLTITFGSGGYHGWWGPWGYRPYYPYRPPYYPGYRPPYYPGYRPPGGGTRPPLAGTRPPAGGGTRPRPGSPAQLPAGGGARPRPGGPAQLPAGGDRAARPANSNLYARDNNRTRNAATPSTSDRSRPGTAAGRPNNVYTDRSGNVYRRNSDGAWDRRQGGDWTPSTGAGGGSPAGRPSTRPSQPSGGSSAGRPSTRPSQPSGGSSAGRPSTRPSQPQGGSSLNRDYGARSRGQSRSNQFRSTPRPSAPRGGARPSGGGARRR
jgi:hypothetical protein